MGVASAALFPMELTGQGSNKINVFWIRRPPFGGLLNVKSTFNVIFPHNHQVKIP